MSAAFLNRFEWLKAVMQAEDLNPAAKNVATALAVQFANDQTGQINPSVVTLADYLKTSGDTVKRAVRALVEGGWLGRTEGRGRGNRTTYILLSPGRVVAISDAKKGAGLPREKGGSVALSHMQKGADMHEKGGNAAPSRIEQSFEQNGAPAEGYRQAERYRHHRFAGNAWEGPAMVSGADHAALGEWGRWLIAEGFPPLAAFPIKRAGGKRGSEFYGLPWKRPPTTAQTADEARAYFASMLPEEARYAGE
ncbi:MAG: hypothetical protein KDK11_11815 [Maritimibacter sp.]|nr:hypothetical protein [Maritimibacter sp.]